MDSQKTSVGAKIIQTSSNHGELFGVVGKTQVIYVKTGEDILSKIMTLSQQGPMKICVHSATGGIRNVALQESATGGGIVTYEVRSYCSWWLRCMKADSCYSGTGVILTILILGA
uniref:AT-hook motif nuclear-localized protein n=1 Tax=Solanum lycopersicum TaxID=4081 RepID=A0A3Q7G4L1_SOLLC